MEEARMLSLRDGAGLPKDAAKAKDSRIAKAKICYQNVVIEIWKYDAVLYSRKRSRSSTGRMGIEQAPVKGWIHLPMNVCPCSPNSLDSFRGSFPFVPRHMGCLRGHYSFRYLSSKGVNHDGGQSVRFLHLLSSLNRGSVSS